MEEFKVGDRVQLNYRASLLMYVRNRKSYTNIYDGKKGTIIRIAGTGKYGIEFDEPIFINHHIRVSSHDNGCHGTGKIHYCWYFPVHTINLIETNTISDSITPSINNNLLLLL